MHHQHIAIRSLQPSLGDAEKRRVFADRGEEAAVHPLELDSQHVHYIDPFYCRIQIGKDLDGQLLDLCRKQGAWTAQPNLGSHLGQAP